MDWSISYTINLNTGVTTAIIEPINVLSAQPLTAGFRVTRPPRLSVSSGRQEPGMTSAVARFLGIALLAIGLGGITGPLIPSARLEAAYWSQSLSSNLRSTLNRLPAIPRISMQMVLPSTFYPLPVLPPLPVSAPVVFSPLVDADGNTIEPINREFSLVVPSVGINASIVEGVDPANTAQYLEALKTGIAHASTSFLPDENGTVYLFSHSTNYDWFVKDLNAVFYLLKNLKSGDLIVIVYKDKQYTYRLRETKVVKPSEISYLVPTSGEKTLILQTCWPPGSVSERLLLFADLITDEKLQQP